MTAYATIADMEANVDGWVTDDADALTRLLEQASRDIDTLLGARPILTTGAAAGMKVDVSALDAWQATALAFATTTQALYLFTVGPDAVVRGAVKRTSGPVFSVERAAGPANGRVGPAVPGLVTATGLARPWGSMTPSAVGRRT